MSNRNPLLYHRFPQTTGQQRSLFVAPSNAPRRAYVHPPTASQSSAPAPQLEHIAPTTRARPVQPPHSRSDNQMPARQTSLLHPARRRAGAGLPRPARRCPPRKALLRVPHMSRLASDQSDARAIRRRAQCTPARCDFDQAADHARCAASDRPGANTGRGGGPARTPPRCSSCSAAEFRTERAACATPSRLAARHYIPPAPPTLLKDLLITRGHARCRRPRRRLDRLPLLHGHRTRRTSHVVDGSKPAIPYPASPGLEVEGEST